jgi:outer membrane lipopolysaccharide assembly protein LptE/RlpB
LKPDEPYTPQQRAIRTLFRSNGIHFYEATDIGPGASAYYEINLLDAAVTRDVIIIGTDAQAKQEQIIIAQRYRIVPPHGEPMPAQIISVQRILNVDQNRVLGQGEEEIVLMQEMRDDIAQQLLKRIALLPQARKAIHDENQP